MVLTKSFDLSPNQSLSIVWHIRASLLGRLLCTLHVQHRSQMGLQTRDTLMEPCPVGCVGGQVNGVGVSRRHASGKLLQIPWSNHNNKASEACCQLAFCILQFSTLCLIASYKLTISHSSTITTTRLLHKETARPLTQE